jgi:hypothetical protein
MYLTVAVSNIYQTTSMESNLQKKQDEQSTVLNIELIHADYAAFQVQPEAYLMLIIK